MRAAISATATRMPTVVTASVVTCTSRLRMCDISCASTPSSSRRDMRLSSPLVTATPELFGERPNAKALGAGSSTM